MNKNTAKITDPIWDSRNSDEPDVSLPEAAPKHSERPIANLIDAASDLYNAACSLMKQRFCDNGNEWPNLENAAMRFDAAKQAATIDSIASQKHKQCQTCKTQWSAENTPNVCPVCGGSVVKIGPVILNGKDRFG